MDVFSLREDTLLVSGEALPTPEATVFTPPSRITVPVVELYRVNLDIAAPMVGYSTQPLLERFCCLRVMMTT